jgi:hypothetical protein
MARRIRGNVLTMPPEVPEAYQLRAELRSRLLIKMRDGLVLTSGT